jgi:Leucine-rich repeat (LRR) protein
MLFHAYDDIFNFFIFFTAYLTLHTTSKITDARLLHISKLINLQYLDLSNCDITDIGLLHISKLINFQHLDLSHCDITDIGLTLLKNNLPNITINITNKN